MSRACFISQRQSLFKQKLQRLSLLAPGRSHTPNRHSLGLGSPLRFYPNQVPGSREPSSLLVQLPREENPGRGLLGTAPCVRDLGALVPGITWGGADRGFPSEGFQAPSASPHCCSAPQLPGLVIPGPGSLIQLGDNSASPSRLDLPGIKPFSPPSCWEILPHLLSAKPAPSHPSRPCSRRNPL